VSPTCYGPPSGFGCPLGGLRPSVPSRFFFAPAALMGFLPFGAVAPGRYPSVSASNEPTYRFTRRCSLRPKTLGRPDEPRFLGFDPAASSDRMLVGLAPQPPVTPLGFTLPGFFVSTLAGISPDLLSRASLERSRIQPARTGASEFRSALTTLIRQTQCPAPGRTSNPLRVFAPAET